MKNDAIPFPLFVFASDIFCGQLVHSFRFSFGYRNLFVGIPSLWQRCDHRKMLINWIPIDAVGISLRSFFYCFCFNVQISVAAPLPSYIFLRLARWIFWICLQFVRGSLPGNLSEWNYFSGTNLIWIVSATISSSDACSRTSPAAADGKFKQDEHMSTFCETINFVGYKLKNFVAEKHLIERTIIFGVNTSRGFDLYKV